MQIDTKTLHTLIKLVDGLRVELTKIQLFPGTDYYESQTKHLDDLRFILSYKILPELTSKFSFPVILVLAGGTNVGKSTIFNLLTGSDFSPANPVGGNTQAPVFALPGHKTDSPFKNFIISLEQQSSAIAADALHEHAKHKFNSLAFIDSPDIDSINRQNHFLAERLLLLADVIVFVATKEKYADRKPLLSLAPALEMQKAVLLIFNKTGALELNQVYDDFTAKSRIKPIFKTHFPFKHEFNLANVSDSYFKQDCRELRELQSFLTQLNSRHTELKKKAIQQNLNYVATSLKSMHKIFVYEQAKIADIRKSLQIMNTQAQLEYQAFIKQMKFIEFEAAVELAIKDLKIPFVDAVYDKVSAGFVSLIKAGRNVFSPVYQSPNQTTASETKTSAIDRSKAIKQRKQDDVQFIATLIKKRCHEFLIRLGNQKQDQIACALYAKIDFNRLFSHVQANVPMFYAEIDRELEQQFQHLTKSIENWFNERRTTKYSLIAIKLLLMAGIGVLSALLTGGIGLEDLVISSISPFIVKRVLDALNPHISFIKNERRRFEKIHHNMFDRIFHKVLIDYFNQSVFAGLQVYDLRKIEKIAGRIEKLVKEKK